MPPSTTTPRVDAPDRIIAAARHRLGLGDGALETLVLASAVVALDDRVDTMAVGLDASGVARVLANPGFVSHIGVEGTAFVLAHEAFHVVLGHLAVPGGDALDELAREVLVNHWVLRSGHPRLPAGPDGTPIGVDPRLVHADYQQRVGDGAVDYEAFVATDEGCRRELARLEVVPRPRCDHGHAPAVDADAVTGVLDTAVRRAADGDDRLRRQLLDLEDQTPDSPAWARVGVSELRGVASRLGDTGFWRHHLRSVVGRLLRPRTEVAYDRKAGWWDRDVLAAIGIEPPPGTGMPLVRVPRPRSHRHVAVYVDTSGSVPTAVVDGIAATVGPIPDTTVAWHTFDHEVHPFDPGDELVGGGGTDFVAVADHVGGLDPPPDAVLVLTDGFAPPVRPAAPERWIWLVLDDGDPWPAGAGMTCITVHLPHATDRTHP